MMKKQALHFLLWAAPLACPGQNFKEDATVLIQAGKLAEAEELTNRYLVQDPTNVDAITMKGNVILNKYLYEEQALRSVLPNFDEDVYLVGQVEKGPYPVVVGDSVAREVAKLWSAAVRLDPARPDIHLGLCQLYSLASMKAELLVQLPLAKEKAAQTEDLQYHLTTYARNLKDRGDFDGAMEVSRAICRLYPSHTGLLSDMAADFYFANRPDSALLYLRRSIAAKNTDEPVLGNAFFLASLLGDYALALDALRRLPGSSHLLYEGLVKLLDGDKKWGKTVEKFLDSSPDSTEAAFASILLADTFRVNLENYLRLTELEVGDPFKLLVHLKFRETGQFLPYFNAAETYCFQKNYRQADAAFRQLLAANPAMELVDRENVLFYHAWSLRQLGRPAEALPMWEALAASENFYQQSAACWFLGKYHFDQGQKTTAREYFSKVADRPSESKFATMCWEFMGLE